MPFAPEPDVYPGGVPQRHRRGRGTVPAPARPSSSHGSSGSASICGASIPAAACHAWPRSPPCSSSWQRGGPPAASSRAQAAPIGPPPMTQHQMGRSLIFRRNFLKRPGVCSRDPASTRKMPCSATCWDSRFSRSSRSSCSRCSSVSSGCVVGLLGTLLFFAFIGFLIYLVLKVIAPETAARVREMIAGRAAAGADARGRWYVLPRCVCCQPSARRVSPSRPTPAAE